MWKYFSFFLQTIVFESDAKYDLIFTILDYPPINLDEIGLPPESLIPIEVSNDIYNNN